MRKNFVGRLYDVTKNPLRFHDDQATQGARVA